MGTEDADRKGAGAREVGSLPERGRYRLDEPQDPSAAPVEAALQEPLVPFAALLLAMQRQDELRALTRQRAALVASFGCEPRPPAPQDEWRRLWDDMERDAAAPKLGFEPSEADPQSPDANPEIAEWERHWPSQANCGCDGQFPIANEEQGAADRDVDSMPVWLPRWLAWLWHRATRDRRR